MKRERVLITGAAGFLGSHLCERFLKEGYHVIGMDNLITGDLRNLHFNLNELYQLAFANGGNQNNKSIPEAPVCLELGIELIEGLGDKIQSSSWLLKK